MPKLNMSINRDNAKRKNSNNLDFDVDVQYIKGLYDAFRFVGGEINTQNDSIDSVSSVHASKMLHTMKSLSPAKQSSDVTDLKLDLLTMQDTLSKTNLKLKSVTDDLKDKKEEIYHFRQQLEQKNILLEQKNKQIAQLNETQSWSVQQPWQSTENIKAELKETKEKLMAAKDEINVLRHELELRNISINKLQQKSIIFR